MHYPMGQHSVTPSEADDMSEKLLMTVIAWLTMFLGALLMMGVHPK